MSGDKCDMCGKDFLWYWRWKHSCHNCHSIVCSACLSYNIKKEKVCDQCHFCSKCHSMVSKTTLKGIRSHMLCTKCYNNYRKMLAKWLPGTKQEFLKGSVITKEIKLIKVDDCCENPAEVENILKIETAIAGGNSYIKFFWDKRIRHHEEEYQAGTGPKGNPYYKTRHWTTQHFIGCAVAVVAHPRNKNRG